MFFVFLRRIELIGLSLDEWLLLLLLLLVVVVFLALQLLVREGNGSNVSAGVTVVGVVDAAYDDIVEREETPRDLQASRNRMRFDNSQLFVVSVCVSVSTVPVLPVSNGDFVEETNRSDQIWIKCSQQYSSTIYYLSYRLNNHAI